MNRTAGERLVNGRQEFIHEPLGSLGNAPRRVALHAAAEALAQSVVRLGGSGRLYANGRVVGHLTRAHTTLWELDMRVMTHLREVDGQRCGGERSRLAPPMLPHLQ